MNDGGKARSGRAGGSGTSTSTSTSTSKSSRPGAGEFGLAVARVSAAQICDAVGFASSYRSALDTFADIIVRYICELGKVSSLYADVAGRDECNVLDVIQGLEDLCSLPGFTGAADVDHHLIRSGVVEGIMQFVNVEEDIPFARNIPVFPIARSGQQGFPLPTPSLDERGETSRGEHIPKWLPAFPDSHTYIRTPVLHGKETDLQAAKSKQACFLRKQKKPILFLQDRLDLCNGTASSMNDIGGTGMQVAPRNPFLEPPAQFGEKDVTHISFPGEPVVGNRPSVLEAFSPAIKAASNGIYDPGVVDKKILPSKRPIVHFKFGMDKNNVRAPSLSKAVDSKEDSCFLNNDEKDDKKRRAEMILKKAMENPHELAQM